MLSEKIKVICPECGEEIDMVRTLTLKNDKIKINDAIFNCNHCNTEIKVISQIKSGAIRNNPKRRVTSENINNFK